MKPFFPFILTTISFWGVSQETELTIRPVFGQETLQLNRRYSLGNEWIEFSSLRFYLGNVRVYSGNKVLKESIRWRLIDLENPESMKIRSIPAVFDAIDFELGIDSATNVSGLLDGVLDPIHGMYWAWNSGYINFKIEGHSSLVKTADQLFEFHIGGYLPPFETLQQIRLKSYKNIDNQYIAIDVESLLSIIDISHMHNIMTPGKAAYDLAKSLPQLFYLREIDE
jgi:hypothetical protein